MFLSAHKASRWSASPRHTRTSIHALAAVCAALLLVQGARAGGVVGVAAGSLLVVLACLPALLRLRDISDDAVGRYVAVRPS